MKADPKWKRLDVRYLCEVWDFQIGKFPELPCVAGGGDMDFEVKVLQTYMEDLVALEFGIEIEDHNKVPGLEDHKGFLRRDNEIRKIILESAYDRLEGKGEELGACQINIRELL